MNEIFVGVFQSLPGWILVAVGFHFSLRVLKFPDLSLDAIFMGGGAACAWSIVNYDSFFLALPAAVCVGAAGGFITYFIYHISRAQVIFKLLAGILLLYSFYSVNLRLMDFKTEVTFLESKDVFSSIIAWESANEMGLYRPVSTGMAYIIAFMAVALFWLALRTNYGLLLRVVGPRPGIVNNCGLSASWRLASGLAIANSMVAIGGLLTSRIDSGINVNNYGTIIHALAAIVFGEAIIGIWERLRDVKTAKASIGKFIYIPIIGVIFFCVLRAVAMQIVIRSHPEWQTPNIFSLTGHDLNLVVAFFVVLALLFQQWLKAPTICQYEEDAI